MSWERVYTIENYWDGPRDGVAEFKGAPYYYRSLFKDRFSEDELTETEDIYELTPIDAELLKLVLEHWDIWLRWDAAFYNRETDLSTHPALPGDRPRYLELKNEIERRMSNRNSITIFSHATFRYTKQSRWVGVEVEWRQPNL